MAQQVPSCLLPPSPAPQAPPEAPSLQEPASGSGEGLGPRGPLQLPPKHQAQVPHSCAKLRLGPGRPSSSCLWPQGLLAVPARGPAGVGEQTGWCCPRGTSPPEGSHPGLTFHVKMTGLQRSQSPTARHVAHGRRGPGPPSQSCTGRPRSRAPWLANQRSGETCPPHGHGRPGSQEPALVGTTSLLTCHTWVSGPRQALPPAQPGQDPSPGFWSWAPVGTRHCPGHSWQCPGWGPLSPSLTSHCVPQC